MPIPAGDELIHADELVLVSFTDLSLKAKVPSMFVCQVFGFSYEQELVE